MITLIKIFFFFVLLVFVGGMVARYFMRRFFRKMQDNMNQQAQDKTQRKKEGKVTIEYEKDNKGSKRYKKDQGEYIDYEDVDDE